MMIKMMVHSMMILMHVTGDERDNEHVIMSMMLTALNVCVCMCCG